MTFDREPDLDNANVGMPEQKFQENLSKLRSYQIGSSFFCCDFGGDLNGKN